MSSAMTERWRMIVRRALSQAGICLAILEQRTRPGAMVWTTKKPPEGGLFCSDPIGAGEAIRTPDPNLGKVMLYP